jgi:hypothetical protein
MPTKTWDFKITPPDAPATTRTGVPQDEAIALIRDLMYGRVPAAVETEADAPALAHAA